MDNQDLKNLRQKITDLKTDEWVKLFESGKPEYVLLELIQDTYRHSSEIDKLSIDLIQIVINKFEELNDYVNTISARLTKLEKLKMRWEEVNHPPTQEEIKAEQLNQWFDHKTDDLPNLEPTNNA